MSTHQGMPAMNCPSCKHSLRPISYEHVDIHTCDHCGGEFVGPEQLAHVVRTRLARFPHELLAALSSRTPIFGTPSDECRTLSCPGCGGQTRTINYSGDTAVFVDRCEDCGGIWLDASELEKVQALTERWMDEAPERLRLVAADVARAQASAAAASAAQFRASRFAFVNAVVNRVLDAA